MWAGTKYNVWKIPVYCHCLTLCGAPLVASDVVRVLGVMLTPDLSFDSHVTTVTAIFFQLRQLRRIRRSLDDDSPPLVHAFVASRID